MIGKKKFRGCFFAFIKRGRRDMKLIINCFFQLIKKELYLFFKEFLSRFLDIAITLAAWVIVFGYLMKNTGLKDSYGVFILVSSIASFGLFETIQ